MSLVVEKNPGIGDVEKDSPFAWHPILRINLHRKKPRFQDN